MIKTAEQRFIELLTDYKIIIILDHNNDNHIVMYDKNDVYLIWHQIKLGINHISFNKIGIYFMKEYNMSKQALEYFFKDMILKHFNLKGTIQL